MPLVPNAACIITPCNSSRAKAWPTPFSSCEDTRKQELRMEDRRTRIEKPRPKIEHRESKAKHRTRQPRRIIRQSMKLLETPVDPRFSILHLRSSFPDPRFPILRPRYSNPGRRSFGESLN